MGRKHPPRHSGYNIVGTRINRHRRQGCEGKARYDSKEGADYRLSLLSDNEDMTSYPCPFCRGWHIGHNYTNSKIGKHGKHWKKK